MAHIYIFSPSSAVRDKAAFRRGVERLQAQGHQVELDEAALASHMRFAGDDATRIAAITASEPVLQKVTRSLLVISANICATRPARSA